MWIPYLRSLAGTDMTKALQTLERCRSSLDKSEYKLVEKEWQTICEALQSQSGTAADSEEADNVDESEA